MEKAAGSRQVVRAAHCAAVAAGFCFVGAAAAQAPAAMQERMAAEARAETPLRFEVTTSALPRLDPQDTGFQAPRVDLSLLPVARSGLGVAVGMGFASRPGMLSPAYGTTPPSMDLGVHYRHTLQSQGQLDVTAWRRFSAQTDAYTLVQLHQPVYGARVEMKLAPVRKAGFNAERGFVGMQLESGAKISIKRKDGRPMVYYRNNF